MDMTEEELTAPAAIKILMERIETHSASKER